MSKWNDFFRAVVSLSGCSENIKFLIYFLSLNRIRGAIFVILLLYMSVKTEAATGGVL